MWGTVVLLRVLDWLHSGKEKIDNIKSCVGGNFPGCPATKTLFPQCRGLGFNPWSGN